MKYLFMLITMACVSNNDAASKMLIVADHLEKCTGVSPQNCMLVKESQEDEWTYFYEKIEGFEYEEGYSYELLVNEITVPNPPADASSLRYVLQKIISKTPSSDYPGLYKKWTVLKIDGLEQLAVKPTLNFEKEDSKINGFAGCNNYFSTYSISDKTIGFGALGTTRKLCQDMSTEEAFLKNLSKIARFEIVKKELYLYDQSDKLLILAFSE